MLPALQLLRAAAVAVAVAAVHAADADAVAAAAAAAAAPASGRAVLASNTLERRYLVTDSAALLRYALPVDESTDPPVRIVQGLLERVGIDLKAKGPVATQFLKRDIAALDRAMQANRVDMLLQVPARRRSEASQMLADVSNSIARMEAEVGLQTSSNGQGDSFADSIASAAFVMRDIIASKPTAAPAFDGGVIEELRDNALKSVADLEEVMVGDQGLPFRIPRRYDALPRLEGRAQVELLLRKGANPSQPVRLVATLDGFSAPLNAGNFVDLVQRGVYNDASVQSGEKGFYLQFADKMGYFSDPKLGVRRNVPMEVLVVGERTPVYGSTLDDVGAGDLQPILPVTAFGALASYHSVEDPNDASSQWYVFMFDPRSYQARSMGGNALNGSVSCFGYIVEGKEELGALRPGDTIVSARVISGLERFRPSADSPRGVVS